jgi:hypothetical protein
MRDTELHLLPQAVDEETFAGFVRYLADQRMHVERLARDGKVEPSVLSGLADWEHDTIGGYLDAVAACHEDNRGVDGIDNAQDDNPSRRAAPILLNGKYYE